MEEYLVVLNKSKDHYTKAQTGVVGISWLEDRVKKSVKGEVLRNKLREYARIRSWLS